jgi:radical SAM protein with 4Fe4S-binding SPASM domain
VANVVVIEINPNFHTLTKGSILERGGPVFKEYRRKWNEWPKNFVIGEFPLHLDIEAASICNLRCPFCATSHKEGDFPQGFMDFEIFKRIIDECAEHGLYAIKFNSGARGEPLLHTTLDKMVAYAKKKGILDVYFNTNATLLTKDIGRRLIEAGLDRVSISFEGFEPEVYEKYRVGASFEKVADNVKEFVRLRDKINPEKPLVRIQSVAIPEIMPRLKEYREFWENIVDEVAYIDFKDYSYLKEDLISDWTCPYLWQRMMITWNGKISICGFDYSNNHDLGNVKNTSLRSAWKSDIMEEIRSKHKAGKSHEVEVCNGCAFRTTEMLKIQDVAL